MSRGIDPLYPDSMMESGKKSLSRTLRGPVVALAALLLTFGLLPVSTSSADVVVLRSGRAYAGHIEKSTSRTIQLYDGNLRRLFSPGDVEQVINERPDTSWVLVGDRMVGQRDWKSAAEAYRNALERTDEPDVILRRLARLRDFRYYVDGSDEAESLLASGDYENAASALFEVVTRAQTSAQRHFWTDRLARAYVGLASRRAVNAEVEVDPYLVYALAVAPTCGAAHALLAERLETTGQSPAAQAEFLLALDLDPLLGRARDHLAKMGSPWSYDQEQRNRSGLRAWMERQLPMPLSGSEAALTTAALATAIEQRVGGLGRQPARLLVAAYLFDPTVALAYQGSLPYPEYKGVIAGVLAETATPSPDKTPHDTNFIRAAIAVRIDPRFFRALARIRTEHTADHIAPDGSRGLIPLSQQKWEIAGRLAGVDLPFAENALDPDANTAAACGYFDWLRDVVLKPYVGNRFDSLERIHDNL